eukprot:gnl/TRDRNA2_/TRDRNA2_195826_c0_seq1.p1 gnl/TRDRNA2_/TRDRNA2_195826_c0~~gnl/TRDRNA2_/TRDRNA2_195826_c0_seq1.p1  ORF type:complete len:127 (-),score=30.16 gnl/TRDRNA2_/TRDRNA2_195826_c0_seq1:93-473(-)
MAPKEIIERIGEHGFDLDAFKKRIADEADKRLHIVDVYTEWCGPCLQIVPTLKSLQINVDQFEDRCTVMQIERTALTEYEQRFPMTCKPRFLFYKGGAEVNYVDGLLAPEILAFIHENLPAVEVDE